MLFMEASTTVLNRLTELSPNEVRAELAAIRRQRERLETAENVLQNLLELLDLSEGPAKVATDSGADMVLSDGTEVEVKSGRSKRGLILTIIKTDPGRYWTPAEIHGALTERGVDITRENVRVTLRRMNQAGELGKVGQGKFRLHREASEGA
jgi:hypothetical protein